MQSLKRNYRVHGREVSPEYEISRLNHFCRGLGFLVSCFLFYFEAFVSCVLCLPALPVPVSPDHPSLPSPKPHARFTRCHFLISPSLLALVLCQIVLCVSANLSSVSLSHLPVLTLFCLSRRPCFFPGAREIMFWGCTSIRPSVHLGPFLQYISKGTPDWHCTRCPE